MFLWVNRLSGELRLCGTMASTTHRTAPYLFNAGNFQDAMKLPPRSTKSKTVSGREDRIPSNSVIMFFTILQKMYTNTEKRLSDHFFDEVWLITRDPHTALIGFQE